MEAFYIIAYMYRSNDNKIPKVKVKLAIIAVR
jgi:hypothetical protein